MRELQYFEDNWKLFLISKGCLLFVKKKKHEINLIIMLWQG